MKKINLFLVLQKHPGIKTKANMNIFFLLLLVFKRGWNELYILDWKLSTFLQHVLHVLFYLKIFARPRKFSPTNFTRFFLEFS